MNGDGLPDQVVKMKDDPYFRVRFNTGSAFSDTEVQMYRPEWNANSDYAQALISDLVTPVAPVNDEARKKNSNLPGMGGVYNGLNFGAFNYSHANPIKYVDPDGKTPQEDAARNIAKKCPPDIAKAAIEIGTQNVLTQLAMPVTHSIYEKGLKGDSSTLTFDANSIIARAMSNDSKSSINQKITAAVQSGEISNQGSGSFSSLDLQASIGAADYDFSVTNIDSNSGVATVSVTIADTFNFDPDSRGPEKEFLTAFGDQANLNEFKIEGTYTLKVPLADKPKTTK